MPCRTDAASIHWAATAPLRPVLRIAARAPSNAATHASRVSRSVPSMSNRTARTARTSGLLRPQPPDLVPDMVDRLDRLAFLLPRHRRPVHPGPADGERSKVLLVPDPHDTALPDSAARRAVQSVASLRRSRERRRIFRVAIESPGRTGDG